MASSQRVDQDSFLLPIYLRREPSRENNSAGRFDVQAYRDPECKQPSGRWPWFYSTHPRRNCKRITLNCWTWRAVWLPDLD